MLRIRMVALRRDSGLSVVPCLQAWAPEGLELTLEVKLSRLSRDRAPIPGPGVDAQPAD